MTRLLPLTLALAFSVLAKAQTCYWQQRADYVIRAALDVTKHQYQGQETITYTNNSPDTLDRLFFHLYPNAFRRGA